MSNFAWVTLTTNDTYSLGALVLAHSLRRAGTAHQLAVLVTPGVSEAMRDRLKDVYNVVQEVNVMDSQDAANLALLARPELGITFTKLHCWRLVQFEKCVFLDSDTLVLQNCDELFEREELSAAPDVSWPDCFNSGVFVFKPSLETFKKITEFALENGSFDGGDQGLLNLYFADWAHSDIKKHLPFVYNVTAYASYCYLPAFKQFRDKIKILHFAGKMKPWLIQFNSENKTAYAPSDYAHAADLIQLWWNIFCESVHQKLSVDMNYYAAIIHKYVNRQIYDMSIQNQEYHMHQEYHNYYHHDNEQRYIEQQQQQQSHYDIEVKDFHDPWLDYYDNVKPADEENIYVEVSKNEDYQCNIQESNTCQENNKNEESNIYQSHAEDLNTHTWQHESQEPKHEAEQVQKFDEFHSTVQQSNEQNYEEKHEHEHVQTHTSHCVADSTDQSQYTVAISDSHNECPAENIEETKNSIPSESDIVTNVVNTPDDNTNTFCITNTETVTLNDHLNDNDEHEAGLAGALSQLNLGAKRTPEQEAYEELMRRQCWEAGQIDYTGKDSFDNIWKKITQTMESKPTTQTADKSEILTSADIEDGKVVIDHKTGATITYKVIDGGYEVHTKTPLFEQGGGYKTEVRTFWDPKPVSEEDLAKEIENRKLVKQRLNKEVRIDKNTTMVTREIEGGYEEIYTTINEDGTKSMRTKTFYDSKPVDPNEVKKSNTDQKKKKALVKKSSVDSTDSTESRKVVSKVQKSRNTTDSQGNYTEDTTYEETHRLTENVEITENNRTVRKNSLQEQSIKAVSQSTNTTDGKKKKKTKSNIPPPPPDFIENDTTTVSQRRVPGGVEYTYSTKLESGKTITTSKTVYAEEEVDMTEEEILAYKKTLRDAEKHKNVTTTKKLKSESGTKKIIPSENPGDVTTVETIKIEGGTEYHYTTVTAEGIVKKAVKTVYDPVPSSNPDDDEEEIIEEYEEEIIEPGEKNFKTIETYKKLPQKFEEEVTITHEKKEKKVKKSMMYTN